MAPYITAFAHPFATKVDAYPSLFKNEALGPKLRGSKYAIMIDRSLF